MKRNETLTNLKEWETNPIYTGSIYVKPTENKLTSIDKLYSYLYYFCCCRYIDYV